MTVELLDLKKQWTKIKAGFQGSQFYKSISSKGGHRFVDGINPTVKEAQGRNATPSGAFTGKTFNKR